jgi:hypothetical protein
MWQATGEVAAKVPTLGEIKNGGFCADGWTEEGQLEGRGETPKQIQKRRASRASSLSASRLTRSTTNPVSAGADEGDGYFSAVVSPTAEEPDRMSSTIPEGVQNEAIGSQVYG